MKLHHGRLRTKGWSDDEIQQAEESLERAAAKKHPAMALVEKAVFWGLLFLTVVGVFTVGVVITPLLLVLDTAVVALVLALLGLCLGALYALLVQDIHWLGRHHHAFASLLLGAVAVANILFITGVMNTFHEALGMTRHAPWLLAVVFALALLAPYAYHLLEGYHG